ncbi:MAG: hypothetical protein K2X38_22970 [Gemmataceae bacterium]|nr:hypothetical protein [Gemmataceae bacterium]
MFAVNDVIDGRFHLRKSLGSGAWGELFAADDRPRYGALAGGLSGGGMMAADHSAFVEVVLPSSLPPGITVDTVEREMKAFKNAAGSNLVTCLDCGRENGGRVPGLTYLAMESWGESLEERLQSPIGLTVQDVEAIAKDAVMALGALHARGLHHHGIHPKRIVRVGDSWKITPSGPTAALGPRIVSPEKKIGPAEDVYALGLTILHALLVADGQVVALDDLATDHERWLTKVPEQWRRALARCLVKDPNRRGAVQDFLTPVAAPSKPVIDWIGEPSDNGSRDAATPKAGNLNVTSLEQQKRDLDIQIEKLNAEIQAARGDRVIRLGVFGVRGSGKSSLLAAWSLFCVDRSDPTRAMQLRFPDDGSLQYLKEVRSPILKEGKSRATAMAEPKTIHFEIVLDGDAGREVWRIETMDFSGEFVELMSDKTGVKTFAKQTHEFLQQSHVILCCHRWNDNSQETLEAINRVLANYASHFILALTRLDERGEVPKSPEELESMLQSLEQDSPIYFGNLIANIQDIYHRTGRAGIMAICPLGKNFADPRHLPRGRELCVDDLAPIAIHEPLRYAVERRKEVEPGLHKRLQRLKAELADLDKEVVSARAVGECQRQDERKKLRDELTGLRERLLLCLDKGKMPRQEDQHALLQLSRMATDLDESAMKHECNELQKRITNECGRSAAWRQRAIELLVLVIFAILLGATLLWFAWPRAAE